MVQGRKKERRRKNIQKIGGLGESYPMPCDALLTQAQFNTRNVSESQDTYPYYVRCIKRTYLKLK